MPHARRHVIKTINVERFSIVGRSEHNRTSQKDETLKLTHQILLKSTCARECIKERN